jgi:hypothetical protein
MNSASHHSSAGRDIRIAWVISGDRNKASSRLQGFLIHEWLVRQGYASEIIATDFNRIDSATSAEFLSVAVRMRRSKATHVVFEAPEWTMVQLAQLAKRWGKRVIAVRCDRLPGAYDDNFDLTILPTEGLRTSLGVQRAAIIDDMVEVPADRFKAHYNAAGKLRVAWVGHASYENYITGLISRLKANPQVAEHFDFELISVGAFATRLWSENTVVDDVLACDIALLPIPQGEWFQNKSSNRLAMMFSLAMPVVASRISSYEVLAKHGMNALLADSEAEMAEQLLALRSAELRQQLGSSGKSSLGDRFHIDHIGPQWLAAIRSAQATAPSIRNWRMRVMDIAISVSASAPVLTGHIAR